jgi:chromosome segregation ATPase
MSHETPDSPSAFLIRYLDDRFAALTSHLSQMETRAMSAIDDLKNEVQGLKAAVDALDARDAEDVAELRRLLDEKTAQLGQADADVATLLPEVQALRARIAAHDLDPNFPAPAPPPADGTPPPDAGPVPA